MTEQKTTRKTVGQVDFCMAIVEAHERNETCEDVGNTLGLTPDSVYQRMMGYVKQGINIPKLKRQQSNGKRKSRLDVNELNAKLAERLGNPDQKAEIAEAETAETETVEASA